MTDRLATSATRQLDSLHSISIEIARLHELPLVMDRALSHCLDLTGSAFGFVGLMNGADQMDVAAIKGFAPSDPRFYERFRLIPVRPSVFGIVITERRSSMSNDVPNDPLHVGQPRGHPPVRTFLGVPLQVGERVIGMIGVANKEGGYEAADERLLSTFANQVAVAIDNARLYERQREMIAELEKLHRDLSHAEREQVRQQERERIAAELHDHIEQAIFTIGLTVNRLLEHHAVGPKAAEQLGEVRQLAAGTAEAVREAIFVLSLPGPQTGSLGSALRKLVRQTGRAHELETDLVISGDEMAVPPEVRNALCNVAREALANVVRHASARMVLVSLRFSSDSLDLVIQDDGVGASELILRHYLESSTHYGLKSMHRQLAAAGGSLEVSNGEESGLAVRARVPVGGP
jgi:signal transduction histidine kinase